MFDSTQGEPLQRPACGTGEPLLRFDGVDADGERTGLQACSVTLHRGEVVGLAGLSGSGQGVFLRLAAALLQPRKGTIWYLERSHRGRHHGSFRRAGGGFLPADRLEEGLIPGFTVQDHFALARGLPAHRARAAAEAAITRFDIRGRPGSPVESLSGGNQQRLQLALIPEDAALILLEEPTRGLDVASGHWVWRNLLARCGDRGTIVFSSSELDEILSVSSRVLVFYDGRVVRDLRGEELDYHAIASAMTGN
ncbi:MAG TPA: sugar ABC transporter ATP-binding protein [Sedimenticola sp.]|nr:sugar ABC transporter ATP-binding protein [Sedimenticola sp.]